jgi:hypothetical protein
MPDIKRKDRRLVIGLGNGRCGTRSLAYLLNHGTPAVGPFSAF